VEVEADSTGHKEDGNEEAEADRLELSAESWMRHHFVAVEQGDDRAGDERAEDHLEAKFIRDGCEANEKDDCGSHTDLSGGVLKPEQVTSDAHRMLCASHRAEDHDGKYRQSTEEQKRRPDSAFAGEEQG